MEKIELGHTYQDLISGFTGIATGYVQYITGCNQVLLCPRVKEDGSSLGAEWFDEQRLRRISTAEHRIVLDNGTSPGFDKPAPRR